MTDEIYISSKLFPQEHENETINDNRYGRKLATYVMQVLTDSGIEVSRMYAEDWGIEIALSGFEFDVYVGCGNVDGSEDEYLVFLTALKPYVRKWFRKIPTAPTLRKIHSVLISDFCANPNITVQDQGADV